MMFVYNQNLAPSLPTVGKKTSKWLAYGLSLMLMLAYGQASAQITWTSRTSAADNNWTAVTYGNGLFVAVASTGTGNRVMTSPDGITWTSRTSAADNNWIAVTYGNGLFVATGWSGTGNRVMTSPDGITWTSRTSAADNDWRSIAYGNGLFVAVASSSTGNRVMTSPDGITWTIRNSAADNTWLRVTYGNGLFVAVASTGTGNRVMTSPDGITWTSRTSAVDNNWDGITYGNGLFVAVAFTGTGNRVMTSPDGITWTSRTSAADNQWLGVTYANGIFVAVAQSGTGNRVMTSGTFSTTFQYRTAGNVTFASATNWESSPDGTTWSAAASAPDATANTLAISIRNGHTATVSASITLDQLSVETGGTLVVNGGVELTVADGTGTDLHVNGTLDVQGTNGAINCPGQFELAVGAKLITANENGVTGGAVIDIAGTGTLTWANNTDYVLNGTVPQTANLPAIAIIRNIEINNTSGVVEGQSFVFSLSGTLTLTAGTFDITGAGLEVTFTSTMPIANTGTGTIITDASNVITFGGISGYTIPNKFASAIGTVNVTNTNTVVFNQSFTILNALNLTAGVLNMSGQTLTFDGTTPATLNRTAGTLTTSNTSNIVINENVAGFTFPDDAFTTAPTLGNLTINRSGGVTWGNQALTIDGTLVLTAGLFNMNGQAITFQNSATPITRTAGTVTASSVTFSGAGAAFTTPAGAFTANTIGALTINRTNSLIFGDASITIAGQLTLTAGELNISGKVLILNNSIAEPIASTGAGSIVSDASTVLTIRGSGDYTFPTYAFTSNTCLGSITIERDGNGTTAIPFILEGTLTMDNTALTASRTLTFSVLTVQNGAVPFIYIGSGTFNYNFAVISILNIGSVGNEGGGAVSFGAVVTNTINVRRTAGVTFSFIQASSVNITVGDANIGGLITNGLGIGTGVVTITGDMSVNFIVRNTGTLTVSPTSNITFTGAGDITLPDNLFTTAPAVINNLTMNRTNAVNITKWNNQGLLVNGILTLTKGVLDISDMSFTNSFTFGGSDTPIVRNGTTETGTITTGFNTFMSFTGAGLAFTIPNDAFTFVPVTPMGFLVINRTNNVSLGNQGIAVSIAVQLTSTGKLNLRGNNIVLVGTALISENYADNGVIYDATATSNTAPGGYIEVLAPPTFVDGFYTSVAGIGLEIEGAATIITNVRRYHYPASSANMGKGIKRAFDITGIPDMGVTDLRITYASSELNGINDAIASDMYLSRWTSATGWESFQHGTNGVTFTQGFAPAPNTIEIVNMTTGFSTWTVSASPAPLPITLIGLKGERVAGGQDNGFTEEVRLEWSTASEINNKGFEVEMSADGRNYKKIAFVDGKGNSTTVMSYEFSVHNANDAYYRLKQVDFDGKFSYSPVIFVEGLVGKVVVYPNPNNGKFAISVGKDKLDSPTRLLNAQGVEVWRGVQTEVRTTGLPTGVYFLHTIVAGKTKITKVVIM